MGLERCDEGEIVYQGNVVDSAAAGTHLPVHKRNMGMVFQSYATWPHMTVFENVAYPLRLRRVDSATVRDAVGRVLEQVGLAGLRHRHKGQFAQIEEASRLINNFNMQGEIACSEIRIWKSWCGAGC
jgi:iron(III) transport system ATP-binding protein